MVPMPPVTTMKIIKADHSTEKQESGEARSFVMKIRAHTGANPATTYASFQTRDVNPQAFAGRFAISYGCQTEAVTGTQQQVGPGDRTDSHRTAIQKMINRTTQSS